MKTFNAKRLILLSLCEMIQSVVNILIWLRNHFCQKLKAYRLEVLKRDLIDG